MSAPRASATPAVTSSARGTESQKLMPVFTVSMPEAYGADAPERRPPTG